jgi:hypothetical protein
MKSKISGLLVLFFIVGSVWAETQQTWSFEELESGSLPENCEATETDGKGQKALWEVQEDATSKLENKCLAITNNTNRGEMANILMIKNGVYKNIEFSTKIKTGTGGKNAGGGIIWRAADENHYYLAQWNATSTSLRLYVYIGGKSSLLESTSVEAASEPWQQIDVIHHDETIEILFNGESKISIEDKQLDFKGWVGLWAQGSAMPSFDDVNLYSDEDAE